MSQMKAIADKLLTNASSGYFPKDMICEQILPTVQVAQDSGLLGKYGKEHLRIVNSLGGGRSKYRRVEAISRSTTSYQIEGHGLEGLVSKNDYRNVEDPFDAERDESMGLSSILYLEKEKLLADTLGNTAIITQNVTLSGTSQFNDWNNSDPLSVIEVGKSAIIAGCGEEANMIVMDMVVRNKLKYHPQLLSNLGYKDNRPGGLKDQEIADALGFEKILIGKARYNSAKEGQTDILSAVWGKNIILLKTADKAEIMQNILGYMVRPTGSEPRKVYKQPNFNPPGSTSILVEDEYDMLIHQAAAAYLIKDAIA